jgi:hypothetical protein
MWPFRKRLTKPKGYFNPDIMVNRTLEVDRLSREMERAKTHERHEILKDCIAMHLSSLYVASEDAQSPNFMVVHSGTEGVH